MSQVADAFAAAGLQATVVGLLNSAMQVGQLLSTLGWGLVVEGVGLRASFGAAALVFAEPRDPEGPPRPSERGAALVDRLSAHALAADAADAAAEALRLPLSTGTRFDAQSLSSSPDLRVGARHARPRGDAAVRADPGGELGLASAGANPERTGLDPQRVSPRR